MDALTLRPAEQSAFSALMQSPRRCLRRAPGGYAVVDVPGSHSARAVMALQRVGLIEPTLPGDTTEFISTRLAHEVWAQHNAVKAA